MQGTLAVSLDSCLGQGGRRGGKMPCLFRVQEKKAWPAKSAREVHEESVLDIFFLAHKMGRKRQATLLS